MSDDAFILDKTSLSTAARLAQLRPGLIIGERSMHLKKSTIVQFHKILDGKIINSLAVNIFWSSKNFVKWKFLKTVRILSYIV